MILDRSQHPPITLNNNFHGALPQIVKLRNGSALYIIEDRTQPLALLSITFRLGYTEGKPAVGYFSSKMLTRGTLTKTAEEVADIVESWGGSLSTVIERDTVTMTINVLSRFLHDAIKIMSECLFTPAFESAECEKFRIKVLADIERTENDPQALTFQEAEKHLYRGHPYAVPWFGSKQSMQSVQPEDCREWHRTLLTRKNSIIAAGDVSSDEIQSLTEQYFGDLTNSDDTKNIYIPHINSERKEVFGVHRNDSLQATIAIGTHIPHRTDEDFIALRFLAAILGEGLSSRLTMALREEKAYTYGANALIDDGLLGGVLYMATSVGNDVLNDAVAEMFRQVERLHTELIPDEELERNKQSMIGKTLFSSETPRQRAYLAQYCDSNNLPLTYFYDRNEKINNLTSEHLQSIAQKYMRTEDMLIAVTGIDEILTSELSSFGNVIIKQ